MLKSLNQCLYFLLKLQNQCWSRLLKGTPMESPNGAYILCLNRTIVALNRMWKSTPIKFYRWGIKRLKIFIFFVLIAIVASILRRATFWWYWSSHGRGSSSKATNMILVTIKSLPSHFTFFLHSKNPPSLSVVKSTWNVVAVSVTRLDYYRNVPVANFLTNVAQLL